MNVTLQGLMTKRTRGPTGEPTSWTQRTSNFSTAYMQSGAYGSDGNYVIIGGYEESSPVPRAITQTDPTGAWSLNTSTGRTAFFEMGLIHDGTYWITGSAIDGICYVSDPTGAWSTLSNNVNMSGLFNDGTSMYVCGEGVNNTKYWTATSATGTWTLRTNPFSGDRIYAVGYDGTNWVVAGVNGKMEYSPTPANDATWTTISTPFSTSTVYGVFYANGYWVAVAAGGKIATATSASGSWTLHGDTPFTADTIRSVYYGASAWAICGNAGKIATCGADPTGSWTLRTSSFGGSDSLSTIFYGDGKWVCGGGNGEEGLVATAVPGT